MTRFLTTLLFVIALTFNSTAQTTATEWYKKGVDYNTDLKYTEAANAFEKAIALNKTYADAYYKAGWTYNELADYTKAIDRLGMAIKLKDNYAFALQELGYAYKQTAKYTDALNYFNKAIAAKPDYALAYKLQGDVYMQLKRDAEGVAAYEKAYSLDDNQESACYQLGYYYNANKNFDKALDWLNKAIAIKPKTSTYNEIGFAYYSQKKNDDAIAAYKKALEIEPSNGTAYKGMGDVYRRNYSPAKVTEAIANYRQAIQNNPKSSGSYFGLGWCFNEQTNYDSSIIMLKKALDLDNAIAAAYTELGYAQYMTSHFTDAISTFNKGLIVAPKGTLPVYYKGLVYIALKDKASAQMQYDALKDSDATLAAKLLTKIGAM